jgi:hypothetical protein
MATTAQVRRLVAPLLMRRKDLAFAKRLVFAKPLHHVLSAVLLGRCSDPNGVSVYTVIFPIYHPRSTIPINWGWPLPRPDGQTYSLDQPDAQSLLCEQLETIVLPRLAAIRDIPSFVAHVTSHRNSHRFEFGYHLTTALALGDLERASEICCNLEASGVLNKRGFDAEAEQSQENKRTLCRLVAANDRAAIAALLHEWEAASAERWGLAAHWEPSPFPLETARRSRSRDR